MGKLETAIATGMIALSVRIWRRERSTANRRGSTAHFLGQNRSGLCSKSAGNLRFFVDDRAECIARNAPRQRCR